MNALSALHCPACDVELNEHELGMLDIYDDMCEQCFVESQDDNLSVLIQDIELPEDY